MLVKSTAPEIANYHDQIGARVIHRYKHIGNLILVELPPNLTVPEALEGYRASGLVEFIQPNHYLRRADGSTEEEPEDPDFEDQWNLANIDATFGWAHRTDADRVIVGVIDSGISYTHHDLIDNMWSNLGIDATTDPPDPDDPMDTNGHGTHVAGIIGAVGNNGTNITGVAWSVQLMALKVENQFGFFEEAAVIKSIDYAIENRAQILNLSMENGSFPAILWALAAARNHGIVAVIAAGNSGVDLDIDSDWPASIGLDNAIVVTSTTIADQFASGAGANYGRITVDLAAPGGDSSDKVLAKDI